jgi:hypothetical protein
MKILMIDHCGLQVQTRKILIEDAVTCMIDIAFTSEEVRNVFQIKHYDLIILDHTTEACQKCAEYVLELDPLQPILVVSDAAKCIILRCEDCVNHHHARRLSNPTSIQNIIRMITGFNDYHCDHYDATSNLRTL